MTGSHGHERRPKVLTPGVLIRPRTKMDAAYQLLRRVIVTGDIGTDEPLDEPELMRRFNLSRTPLREALKRLALEQFVTWPPHSTPFVRTVTLAELPSLFEARLILEEPAGKMAALHISNKDLADLDATSDAIEEFIAAGEFYRAVELDHALHQAIAQASGNPFLAQAVSRLNCGSLRLWYIAHEGLRDQTATARHADLIAALRSKDPDRTAEETRRHIWRSYDRQMVLRAMPAGERTSG
jgi:DNA-binding GntR family transcriptional regulator